MRSSLNIEGAECKHDFGYKGYPYQQNSNLQGGVQVMCMQPWFFSMGRLHLGQGLLFARILFIIHKEYSLADIGHFILPHTCQPKKNMWTQNRTLNFRPKNHHIDKHKCMYNKNCVMWQNPQALHHLERSLTNSYSQIRHNSSKPTCWLSHSLLVDVPLPDTAICSSDIRNTLTL